MPVKTFSPVANFGNHPLLHIINFSFDLSPSGLPHKTQDVIYGRPPLVSSLGLVHSTPFASLAMTSVHAKRARSNYSKARTVSDHTNNPNEVIIIY